MLKIALMTVFVLQIITPCFAQTIEPPASSGNPHKDYTLKIQACKKQAADQGLVGEERRASIAQCLRSNA